MAQYRTDAGGGHVASVQPLCGRHPAPLSTRHARQNTHTVSTGPKIPKPRPSLRQNTARLSTSLGHRHATKPEWAAEDTARNQKQSRNKTGLKQGQGQEQNFRDGLPLPAPNLSPQRPAIPACRNGVALPRLPTQRTFSLHIDRNVVDRHSFPPHTRWYPALVVSPGAQPSCPTHRLTPTRTPCNRVMVPSPIICGPRFIPPPGMLAPITIAALAYLCVTWRCPMPVSRFTGRVVNTRKKLWATMPALPFAFSRHPHRV